MLAVESTNAKGFDDRLLLNSPQTVVSFAEALRLDPRGERLSLSLVICVRTPSVAFGALHPRRAFGKVGQNVFILVLLYLVQNIWTRGFARAVTIDIVGPLSILAFELG